MRRLSFTAIAYFTMFSTCGADFRLERFQHKVKDALGAVQNILDTTRHPVLPEDSDHTYEDKYALVDTMTNVAIAASVAVLERLGLSLETLEEVLKGVHQEHKPVSLHFHMDQGCIFIKETERKIVISDVEIETAGTGILERLTSGTTSVKVKNTVQEYHWNITAPYKLILRIGDGEEIQLAGRDDVMTTMIVLGSHNHKSEKRPPPPIQSFTHNYELSLTWLVQRLALRNGKPTSEFSIDRLQETCKTPRRNEEIEAAWQFWLDLNLYVNNVENAFKAVEDSNRDVANALSESAGPFDTLRLQQDIVFDPIIPLFENNTVLPQSDYDHFLSKHADSLDAFIAFADSKHLPSDNIFLAKKEGVILGMLIQFSNIFQSWFESVHHVEEMLHRQMIQAIGKRLTAQDFDEFVSFYSRRLFAEGYGPEPFSYAVRRENHYPDGMLSIESEDARVPIDTLVRRVIGATSPSLAIQVDAATTVEIRGDRFVHGWLQHRWGGFSDDLYQRRLVARAHQFSSFMVMVGVVGPSNTFIAKHAIILQNKDEVLIPLLSKVLPSAKEFKDSIKSLSPEQRAFAETYRRFQLESSVFGVCVLQIKPQLERLLNLPDGALTKEIELTQSLMSLFVDYQIPSDLLSYDGSGGASINEKVATVKAYVKAVIDVIDATKAKQLESERQKAKMREEMASPKPHHRVGATVATAAGGLPEALSNAAAPGQIMMMSARSTGQRKLMSLQADAQGGMDMAESSDILASSESAAEVPPSTTAADVSSSLDDFTMIPKILDSVFEISDKDGALKSTIIKTQEPWSRSRQENLLVKSQTTQLNQQDVASELNKAMDLLRAISRSGSLPIESSELHVVVAVSHCFENYIMDTLIEDNINPIEKVERSMLMIASVIHGVPEGKLLLLGEKPKESIDDSGNHDVTSI